MKHKAIRPPVAAGGFKDFVSFWPPGLSRPPVAAGGFKDFVSFWPTGADRKHGIWISESRHVRPTPYPMHRHKTFEITLILSGKGRLRAWNRMQALEAGVFFAMPPGVAHQLLDGDGALLSRITLFFDPRVLGPIHRLAFAKLVRSCHTDGPAPSGFHAAGIERAMRALMAQGTRQASLEIRAAHLALIVSLAGDAIQRRESASTLVGGKGFHDWWREGNNEAWREADARLGALKSGVGLRQFNRVFRKHTGISFHQWCLLRRLDEVDRMLMEGSPAIHAASAAGFETMTHFFRIYRKYRGHSPGQAGPA